jgi:hypothetical protein
MADPAPILTFSNVSAAAGIAINFIFNIVNFVRANRLRSRTLDLEEFKRLRAPVDAALVKMREHRATLRSLESSGSAVARLKKAIADCNREMSHTYNLLIDALTDIDRSKLVNGSSWATPIASMWDEFCTAIDATYVQQKDLAATKVALKRALDRLDVLITRVADDLDAELHRHKQL